jgi:predicted naringenin-chalcone synthase
VAFIKQIKCEPGFNTYEQVGALSDFLEGNFKVEEDRKLNTLLLSLKRKSSIHSRTLCLEPKFVQSPSPLINLSTMERQQLYDEYSKEFIVRLTRGFPKEQNLDNIISVSCTGYRTPGIDFDLIEHLKPANTPFRYNIGAMGCYAGLVGLRLASEIKGENVLCCLEVCSVHFQNEPANFSNLASAMIFADGAALIETSEQDGEYEILSFRSEIIENSLSMMSWTLSNKGFLMHLDSKVPQEIEEKIHHVFTSWLQTMGLCIEQINHWVVHPGGIAILRAVEKSLNLPEAAMEPSKYILKNHGNMSSGTIFFILDHLNKSSKPKSGDLIALLAFGPGLSVEMGLLRKT